MDPISADEATPPMNVLLLHSRYADPDGCQELCQVDGPSAELHVSFASDDPKVPSNPDTQRRLGLLSIGDVIRAAQADGGPDFSGPVAVDAVPDPTDLAAIGVSISQFCEQWSGNGEQIVVCFNSLDSLLRNTESKTIFEFTYYLNQRLASVGALGHYHLDPSRHEDRIVAAFGDIFDEVVVDDSVEMSLPEASQEEVAELLEDLGSPDSPEFDWQTGPVEEASQNEIEELFGE